MKQWDAMTAQEAREYNLEAFYAMNANTPEDLFFLEQAYG
jgi:hypothetical protein